MCYYLMLSPDLGNMPVGEILRFDMVLLKKGPAILPNFTSLIIFSLAASRKGKTEFKFFETPPYLGPL